MTGQCPARVSMMSEERSEMLDTAWVAGNFSQTLGVRPHIGRVLTMEDDRLGNSNPVVVLQYDFWRSRFAARPEVVGSTIRLNGAPFTVAA
jgi:hypothetical protein